MFYRIKTNTLKYKTSDLPDVADKIYSLPALTAGIQNQGLNNFVPPENATILKRVISISANGANTGVTFFQSKDFTVLQDAYTIDIKKELNYCLNDAHYLFFVSVIKKSIYGKFEYSNKAGWLKVQNEKIKLPIKNGEIDFRIMELITSAIQKLVIKDVVSYLDNKIKASKTLE